MEAVGELSAHSTAHYRTVAAGVQAGFHVVRLWYGPCRPRAESHPQPSHTPVHMGADSSHAEAKVPLTLRFSEASAQMRATTPGQAAAQRGRAARARAAHPRTGPAPARCRPRRPHARTPCGSRPSRAPAPGPGTRRAAAAWRAAACPGRAAASSAWACRRRLSPMNRRPLQRPVRAQRARNTQRTRPVLRTLVLGGAGREGAGFGAGGAGAPARSPRRPRRRTCCCACAAWRARPRVAPAPRSRGRPRWSSPRSGRPASPGPPAAGARRRALSRACRRVMA